MWVERPNYSCQYRKCLVGGACWVGCSLGGWGTAGRASHTETFGEKFRQKGVLLFVVGFVVFGEFNLDLLVFFVDASDE